jgi:hypothetical protein
MKLLLAVLLVGTVVAQDGGPGSVGDALAVTTVAPDSGNTTEAILSAIILILGTLLKVYAGWNKKNDAIASTLIRGIEAAANSATVKAAVRSLAAEEGHTSIIHKKVKKVTEEGKAGDDAPVAPTQAF